MGIIVSLILVIVAYIWGYEDGRKHCPHYHKSKGELRFTIGPVITK